MGRWRHVKAHANQGIVGGQYDDASGHPMLRVQRRLVQQREWWANRLARRRWRCCRDAKLSPALRGVATPPTKIQLAERTKVPSIFHSRTPGARSGDFLYMSCQISTGGDTGSITVTIFENGTLYRSGTANGFPNIASASGSY